ncbi:hypothetical protein [Caldimonas tepidiphila]|uniref:hypothetical protein n=1 Tax=Caldimonas tepidiphila TaxID=2315841 RepID=UPI000E5B82CF|nr:hypothetical protein [Caldimonas tepidiphila]
MPFLPDEPKSAEERFRQAFERLKAGDPKVLPPGTPVTQNNVAREAGCDPSALKKARFPVLIAQIQDYVENHNGAEQSTAKKAKKQRNANRSLQERLDDAVRQRDQIQSVLASAIAHIVDLTEQVEILQQELDGLRPPPIRLPGR